MAGAGPLQQAKRALVRVLLRLAHLYHVALSITRDSADTDVTAAFRKVARRAHHNDNDMC